MVFPSLRTAKKCEHKGLFFLHFSFCLGATAVLKSERPMNVTNESYNNSARADDEWFPRAILKRNLMSGTLHHYKLPSGGNEMSAYLQSKQREGILHDKIIRIANKHAFLIREGKVDFTKGAYYNK